MTADPILAELTRVQNEYARRSRIMARPVIQDYYYSRIVKAVSDTLGPIHGSSVLDVGCGDGTWLKLFRELGASKVAGIELRGKPYAAAMRNVPDAELICGSAHRLPWPDAHFDIVSQFVVFTSILDSTLKQRIAAEMLRVLKPSGLILWFDFRINNPRNRHVRGIGRSEIDSLFPLCQTRLQTVILAPPLANVVVPRSLTLASLLEKVAFLRTHYLGVIKLLTAPAD